jgi:hypothetical protein
MSLLSISTVCTSGGKKTLRKKALAKMASKLKKILANSKFHSHLASWQVVISTPAGNGSKIPSCSFRGSNAYENTAYLSRRQSTCDVKSTASSKLLGLTDIFFSIVIGVD